MQQNTKGLLLFVFLISVSVFGINLYNNNDSGESVEVTETTLFEATTTTSPEVKVEKYTYPSFDFEKETTTSLESISDLCSIQGNWFSLTKECLSEWENSLKMIDSKRDTYLEHYEYTLNYFKNNYANLDEDTFLYIVSTLTINEKINFFMSQLKEVEEVIRIKENQDENTTSIFLSDESVTKSKELETEDLKIGCYLENLEDSEENSELIEVETLNTRDNQKFNYGIKIESSLNIDPECIMRLLDLILNHEKGWINVTDKGFHHTNVEDSDFVYIFASPETTDELCYPLQTNGIYSCRNEREIVINDFRWKNGARDFLRDLETYRLYLINHETGHILGWGHTNCPKEGAIAPVMMQQSKGTDGCVPYGWPIYEIIKANFDY
jgi:hypothetical protein